MKNLRLKSKIYELFETQSAFAQSLGVREDRVSRIIHGRAVATEEEKRDIGSMLGVSPDEIFPG
jgi:plasmid maintenance system antidote protein VapI